MIAHRGTRSPTKVRPLVKELGQYKLIERLGVGGMAEVFLAHARRQGDFVQPCVVKILHKELARDKAFARLILEEARLIAHLRHSNIASLYDVDRQADSVFLVMEYVEGRDLHAVLSRTVARGDQLPLPFALHVAKNLCAGLHFAHTRRGPGGRPMDLIHRDVSPQNILVSTLGEVKLIDFGVAKFNSQLREKTRTGVIKGKFGYMSPEQAWDEELDHRSDLFSVGICLYEMLSGRSVYGQSDDPLVMLKRAREADIEPVTRWRPDVPEDLARVIHRCLAANRNERWHSAHEVERRVTAILARIAPDYTALHAGVILEDLFQIGDPGIEDLSDRIEKGAPAPEPAPAAPREATPPPGLNRASSRGLRAGTRPIIEDTTQPMAEVPEEVRASGRHAATSRDSATPDEATVAITFSDDDFVEEKTHLFDESRVSGAHPAASRSLPPSPRNRKSGRRDAAQHTRQIDKLDEKDTDPRRETLGASQRGARESGRFGALHELPRDDLSGPMERPSVLVADDISLDTSVLEQNRRDIRERNRPRDAPPTDQMPMATARERAAEEIPSTPYGDGLTESPPHIQPGGLPEWLQDRRVQVIGGGTFVVLAALFVFFRLVL